VQQRYMFESPVRTKSKFTHPRATIFLSHSPEGARRYDQSRSAVLA